MDNKKKIEVPEEKEFNVVPPELVASIDTDHPIAFTPEETLDIVPEEDEFASPFDEAPEAGEGP